MALAVKNSCAKAGDVTEAGSIPESGRSPEEGNGNPLQYSCLKNPMDRGTWQAAIHGTTKSWTWLKQLTTAPPFYVMKVKSFSRVRVFATPGIVAHRIFQARVLEWVAISFSRVSSWPRDQTWVSQIAGRGFTSEPPGKIINFSWQEFLPIWFTQLCPQSLVQNLEHGGNPTNTLID